ncbi:unnamed protein product, partial [Sphacelaria rigidula]
WRYIADYYTVSPTTEKVQLDHEWQALDMNLGEDPRIFLDRAKLIRYNCAKLGVVISDADANRHYIRRLSSDFDIVCGVLRAFD